MKIRPNQLPENGYFLFEKLEHKELTVFLRKYLNKRTTFLNCILWKKYFFLLIAIFLFVVNLLLRGELFILLCHVAITKVVFSAHPVRVVVKRRRSRS